jgi:hypothetical protein
MTYGLGAIQSPPDERDFELALDAASAVPAAYTCPHRGPILDQGNTPMCVASFDLSDLGHTYKWDEPYFFQRIGGGPNGAVIRNAFKVRLSYGYPLLPSHSGNSAASHRIAAYYAVPKAIDSIKRAMVQYGVLIAGVPWYNSWFSPHSDGKLPPADYQVGGHAIQVTGYDTYGPWFDNTWGTDYGVTGRIQMSWGQFMACAWEVWKATDQKTGG